jgi:hypothetical protein
MLAGGIQWDGKNPKMQEVDHRPDEWYENPPDEARVAIWVKGQGIPVYTPNGTQWLSVNVFTELTSLYDFVGIMQMIAAERESITVIGEAQKPEQSELDKAFPRDANGQPVGNPPPAAPPQQPQRRPQPAASPTGSDYIGGYNHKLKEQYIASYGGCTIRTDVLRMKRVWNQNDGSPEIEVYSSWNESLSKYPAYSLKIKHKRLSEVDDYTRSILTPIFDAPRDQQPENTTPYYGSYVMFVPKDSPDKLYPLLVKLTPKSGQPERDVMREDDPEDIPF